MENAICFGKHDGVDITTLKAEPCDGKDSQGKRKNQQINFVWSKDSRTKTKTKTKTS
jgi:hypothetical protein